ncbi:MAG: hypothetical protein KBD78_08945 [Oligoflexales bacterium]|nr:hypothetical protein [Oligoflexales bacterium]
MNSTITALVAFSFLFLACLPQKGTESVASQKEAKGKTPNLLAPSTKIQAGQFRMYDTLNPEINEFCNTYTSLKMDYSEVLGGNIALLEEVLEGDCDKVLIANQRYYVLTLDKNHEEGSPKIFKGLHIDANGNRNEITLTDNRGVETVMLTADITYFETFSNDRETLQGNNKFSLTIINHTNPDLSIAE